MKNSLGKSTYPFFETIRVVDGKVQLLKYHQRRIDHVFRYFYPSYRAIELKAMLPDFSNHSDGVVKFRFEYNAVSHDYNIQQYTMRTIKKLVLTETDINYPFKFSNRNQLNNLMSKIPAEKDILMTSRGRIRETSYANVIVQFGKNWLTPLYPMFHGVMRSHLLAMGVIKPADLFDHDLRVSNQIMLINAMMPMESTITLSVKDIEGWK